MIDTVKNRLSAFREYKGIKVRPFETSIGVSNGYLKQLKNIPSNEILERIYLTYPELSRVWLLTGEGEMLMRKEETTSSEEPTETRPRVPSTAAAGSLSGFSDESEWEWERYPIIKAFPTYDFTIIVKGNSMEPKFEGGDEVAIKKVCDFIEWGKVYVLDTRDGAVLKRLYDNGDKYRCVSFNDEYPDFEVNKEDVYGVYKVVGLIRI